MIMTEKVKNLTRKTEALRNTISQVERELEARDSIFLQVNKKIFTGACMAGVWASLKHAL